MRGRNRVLLKVSFRAGLRRACLLEHQDGTNSEMLPVFPHHVIRLTIPQPKVLYYHFSRL